MVGLDVAVGSALSNQGEGFDNFLSATVISMAHALSDRGRPIYYRKSPGNLQLPPILVHLSSLLRDTLECVCLFYLSILIYLAHSQWLPLPDLSPALFARLPHLR